MTGQTNPEQFSAPGIDPANLGQAALANTLNAGNYSVIDRPDDHIRIEFLAPDVDRQAVPLETAFRHDADAMSSLFAEALVDGIIRTEEIDDPWDVERNGDFVLKVEYTIDTDEATYEAAKAAGTPHTLVSPEQKRATLKQHALQKPEVLEELFIYDLQDVEGLEDLENLTQAIEFTVAPLEGQPGTKNSRVRILNTADRLLTPEHIYDFGVALRFMADYSSGDLPDELYTVVILPNGHSSLMDNFPQKDGSTIRLPRNGYKTPHMFAMSVLSLLSPEERGPIDDRVKRYLESFLKPGESPDSIKEYTMSGGQWRLAVIHEMVHIALQGFPGRVVVDDESMVSFYARVYGECASEAMIALFLGGEDADRVSQGVKDELHKLRELLRKERTRAGQPLGPHSVAGREIDLSQGSLTSRLRNPGDPLYTKTRYTRVQTTPPPSQP